MTVGHRRAGGELVKVVFQLEPGAWHGSGTETLWAERVDERRFRLRNVPFFVFGVGVDDVIFAREAGDDIFEFESVSIHGGHSTYRIIAGATISSEQINSKWQELEELGCTYEQGPGRLRAVDAPPKADIHKVYALLEEGERGGLWDFEEGYCGHAVST
jgi:hypothetical protein